jgi:hypothetical protein
LLRDFGSVATQNRLVSVDLSETQFEQTELLLGARFPESYRRSMLLHNGGGLDIDGEPWELIPIRDDRSQRRALRTEEDVLGWTYAFQTWRAWPKGAISIARNGVGDALLFLREHDRIGPEVYLWRHESGTLEKIASDFGEMSS